MSRSIFCSVSSRFRLIFVSFSMIPGKKQRAVAPKELSVDGLEQAIESYLEHCGSRDLTELLSHLKKAAKGKEANWKTAPVAETLAMYAPLYEKLFELSPNTILSPKKVASALLFVHRRKPINFTRQKDEDWVDEMSVLIRMGCAKFRVLVDEPDAYRRCMCKAAHGPSQPRAIYYRPGYYLYYNL